MNWWPWQTKQVPAHTAGSTAPILPLGGAHHNDILSSPIHDMTYLAAGGARMMGNAIEEANRGPGQGEADIQWYRKRARTAEAEARKLRLALYDILGEVPGWKVEDSARGCFDEIDDIALTALGHPSKSEAWNAEAQERRAK